MSDADILVYDRDERLTAAVEVIPRTDTSASWASRIRRDMLSNSPDWETKFVLIIARDNVYIWPPGIDNGPIVTPTAAALGHYTSQIDTAPETISPEAMELIAGIWLSDLARLGMNRKIADAEAMPIEQSGLLDSIRDGRVEFRAAA